MNRQQRRAAQAQQRKRKAKKPREWPPGYIECVKEMARLIPKWLRAQPTTPDLQWHDKKDGVLVTGDLTGPAVKYLAASPDAERLLAWLDERTGKQGTVLQARVALGMLGLIESEDRPPPKATVTSPGMAALQKSFAESKEPQHVPPSPCPKCGRVLDCVSGGGGSEPAPGMFSVCLVCTGVAKFDADLKLQAVPDEELAALAPGGTRTARTAAAVHHSIATRQHAKRLCQATGGSMKIRTQDALGFFSSQMLGQIALRHVTKEEVQRLVQRTGGRMSGKAAALQLASDIAAQQMVQAAAYGVSRVPVDGTESAPGSVPPQTRSGDPAPNCSRCGALLGGAFGNVCMNCEVEPQERGLWWLSYAADGRGCAGVAIVELLGTQTVERAAAHARAMGLEPAGEWQIAGIQFPEEEEALGMQYAGRKLTTAEAESIFGAQSIKGFEEEHPHQQVDMSALGITATEAEFTD